MEQESTHGGLWTKVSDDGKHAAAGMNLGMGPGQAGTKPGGGGKDQPYGEHGQYLGTLHAANTRTKTATDAGGGRRRISPKEYSPVPNHDDGGAAFYKALRFREASDSTATKGAGSHTGLYQMGQYELQKVGALDDQGRWTGKYGWSRAEFMDSPGLQEKAVREWHGQLWREIQRNNLDRFEGQVVGGNEITASGMLAGAHLKGVAELGRYLRSNGSINPRDALGTDVGDYVKDFGGYPVQLQRRR